MRFKRMIAALLSAAIYMTAGAAAAELPQDAAEAETTAVTTETAAERDLTQDLPQARAVVSAAKTTHAFQLNGKAVTNPQAYLINKYNYFKLRDVAYLLRNSTAEFEVGWEKSTNVITLTTGKNYTAVGGRAEHEGTVQRGRQTHHGYRQGERQKGFSSTVTSSTETTTTRLQIWRPHSALRRIMTYQAARFRSKHRRLHRFRLRSRPVCTASMSIRR